MKIDRSIRILLVTRPKPSSAVPATRRAMPSGPPTDADHAMSAAAPAISPYWRPSCVKPMHTVSEAFREGRRA